MNKSIQQATEFLQACEKHGFKISVKSTTVIAIKKVFTPGDSDAYSACDAVAASILAGAPLKGGSIWGTDGASIGGHIGLKNGYYELNKSGSGVRFMNALTVFLRGNK